MPEKKIKLPKTMGACADLLYATRQLRLDAQKKIGELEATESALKEHIINTLPKSDSSGVAGKLARVSVETKIVPKVEDWDKLYAHVLKTKNFNLLQRQVSRGVVEEIWQNKKQVPGVKPFNAITVSVNKL